ncbi:MAG: crossover junction endodeoxyribonuclease RuvC [Clostridia bacterium]|nr:crossover junction endodeoxyribonuclease RuvC [Clostridia bacterium]
MRVFGIDPGLATMGYGIVDTEGRTPRLVTAGAVITKPDMRMYERLHKIYVDVRDLLQLYQPDDIVFEELFFAKNITTALNVAAARGSALCDCAEFTHSIYEYTPMQIKQATVGYGKADKHQMQHMVKLLLNLDDIVRPDDAADAVAAALTHINAGVRKEQFLMK